MTRVAAPVTGLWLQALAPPVMPRARRQARRMQCPNCAPHRIIGFPSRRPRPVAEDHGFAFRTISPQETREKAPRCATVVRDQPLAIPWLIPFILTRKSAWRRILTVVYAGDCHASAPARFRRREGGCFFDFWTVALSGFLHFPHRFTHLPRALADTDYQ